MHCHTSTISTNPPADTRAGVIAAQNDAFRSTLGSALHDGAPILGRIVTTRAIHMLPRQDLLAVLHAVRTADDFAADNDPYREHDFGSCRLSLSEGQAQIYWKFDYYSGAACEFGAEDPADPGQTYRVLTIMFSDEH